MKTYIKIELAEYKYTPEINSIVDIITRDDEGNKMNGKIVGIEVRNETLS